MWVVIVALLAFFLPSYLLLMWIAGVALDGDAFKLIGLQKTRKDLRSLHWTQFERLTTALFRAEQYLVKPRGGPRPDGGVDAEISKDGKTWIVQTKHWPNNTFFVEVTHVRELLGVVTKKGAAGGVFVTSGIFGEPAREFANGTPLELIDGDQFWSRLARAQGTLQPNVADRGLSTGRLVYPFRQRGAPRSRPQFPSVGRTAQQSVN